MSKGLEMPTYVETPSTENYEGDFPWYGAKATVCGAPDVASCKKKQFKRVGCRLWR
jgi:hypothetical protein